MNILAVSLGCDKNLVDSERMMGMLAQEGYTFTDNEAQADIIIVNTCCFIHDAKEESVNTLLAMAGLKKEGRLKVLIAAGCLAQRYQEEIRKEIPEVDAVIGTMANGQIVDVIAQALKGRCADYVEDVDGKPFFEGKRLVSTGGHFAYLKIAEGCDKHCTYCIIPKVRGKYRSIPMEALLSEATELAKGGVKELILVAQETTLYGNDLYGRKTLPLLLKKLCGIDGLLWIRLLYCYPEEITDELIETIKTEPKLCHYLDMPIQHSADGILKRMGRRTSRADLAKMIRKLRTKIPDICLRTTLITGFPGETQKDHEDLLDFIGEMEFDRLGVFSYSQEEDTPAAAMPGQIPEELKEGRRAQLMGLQQEIAYEKAENMRGRIVTAMIEGKLADEDAYVGRTYQDAPNVDGYVFIHTCAQLMSGDFVSVKITGAYEYDLIGELYDESAE